MKELLFIKVGVMLLNGCLNKMTKKPFENKIKKIEQKVENKDEFNFCIKNHGNTGGLSKGDLYHYAQREALKELQKKVQKEIDKFWEERTIKKVSEKEYIPNELKDFVKRGIKITKKKYTIFDENNKQELLKSLGEIK